MATNGSVDLNCELTYSSVSGAALTPDAAYRTYEAKNTASCRNTLPGSSGTSPVESRGVYSQGMVIHGDSVSAGVHQNQHFRQIDPSGCKSVLLGTVGRR